MRLALLLSPASNRVYAGSAGPLASAELEICARLDEVGTREIAGVDYLEFEGDPGDPGLLRAVAGLSARLGLFGVGGDAEGDLLRPIRLPSVDLLDDDFVTIPKYPGKTNEQFTRLLLNVTRSQVDLPADSPWAVLDPLAGRGTTAAVAWTLGLHAAGVEADVKAFEAMAAYWRTWLRRKRLKHQADTTPVRRDGQSLGKRFDAWVTLPTGQRAEATFFTGDTRDSAKLFGKRTFEMIVADAPYGVVHGSRSDVRGVSGKRDRSPAGLLTEALPVWAGQLKPGGAMGLSWNTFGLSREDLGGLLTDAGLTVCDGAPWLRFGHRVDSSIHRDLIVARR